MPVVIEHDGKEQTYHSSHDGQWHRPESSLNLDPRDHPEVMDVSAGSPAEKAGLKPGDHIISFAGSSHRQPGPDD